MKLYNSLSRQIEDVVPQTAPTVTVYTCGPTVYDYPHVGNWFTYIREDLLIRTLKMHGLEPKWVMNITDVGHLVSDADEGEDKLEKGARREGKTAWDIAEFYTNYFVNGTKRLNMLQPQELPRATDHILEQIELIQKLEKTGYTYIIDDGVYFDTSKFPRYADLARLDLDEQQAGARVEHNPQKRQPTDFAIWKFSPTDHKRDMEWWAPWQRPNNNSDEVHKIGSRAADSSGMQGADEQRAEPYRKYGEGAAQSATPQSAESASGAAGTAGRQAGAVRGSWGFPGWHIECSAMSMKYLGPTLDIHAGGIDHLPVHHTNEVAQSEAATGQPFARYWLHSNHITIEGDKISKSLQNGITLEDIENHGISLEAFRLHVLESHYRSQSKFSWESLQAAQYRLDDLKAMAALRHQTIAALHDHATFTFADVSEELVRIMGEDLHSEAALAYLSEVTKQTLAVLVSDEEKIEFITMLESVDAILGTQLSNIPDISSEQKQLVADREAARMAANWDESDRIRDELAAQGIGLRDTNYGAIWFPRRPV